MQDDYERLIKLESQYSKEKKKTLDIESQINKEVEKLNQCNITCEQVRIDKITGKQFTFFKDPDELPIELYEI